MGGVDPTGKCIVPALIILGATIIIGSTIGYAVAPARTTAYEALG